MKEKKIIMLQYELQCIIQTNIQGRHEQANSISISRQQDKPNHICIAIHCNSPSSQMYDMVALLAERDQVI